jgi:hypothetical protein
MPSVISAQYDRSCGQFELFSTKVECCQTVSIIFLIIYITFISKLAPLKKVFVVGQCDLLPSLVSVHKLPEKMTESK